MEKEEEENKNFWTSNYKAENTDHDSAFIQIGFNHENDTEDIPEGQNPYGFDDFI